jgi:hypothetical protein
MIKQIIKEAMEKNPLGLKGLVEEELRRRISLAIEAKMDEVSETDDLEEAVVGAGFAMFDDGTNTTISAEDAAAINRMFASKSTEEQRAVRMKMKSSKSYYRSVLAKARKG